MAAQSVLRVSADGTDISTLDPHCAAVLPEKGPISWIFGGLVRFPPGALALNRTTHETTWSMS